MSYEDLAGGPGPDRIVTIHVPDSSLYSVSVSAIPHYVSEYKIRNLLTTIDGLQQSIERSYRQDNTALTQFLTKVPVIFPLFQRILRTVESAFSTMLSDDEMQHIRMQFQQSLDECNMNDVQDIVEQQQHELLTQIARLTTLSPAVIQTSSTPALIDTPVSQLNPFFQLYSMQQQKRSYSIIFQQLKQLSRSIYQKIRPHHTSRQPTAGHKRRGRPPRHHRVAENPDQLPVDLPNAGIGDNESNEHPVHQAWQSPTSSSSSLILGDPTPSLLDPSLDDEAKHDLAVVELQQLNHQQQPSQSPNGFSHGYMAQLCGFCKSQQQHFLQNSDDITQIFTSSTSFHPQTLSSSGSSPALHPARGRAQHTVEADDDSNTIDQLSVEQPSPTSVARKTASIINGSAIPRCAMLPSADGHDTHTEESAYDGQRIGHVNAHDDNTSTSSTLETDHQPSQYDAIGPYSTIETPSPQSVVVSTASLNKRLILSTTKASKTATNKCTCAMMKVKDHSSPASALPSLLFQSFADSVGQSIMAERNRLQHSISDARDGTDGGAHHTHPPVSTLDIRSSPTTLKDLSTTTVSDRAGVRTYPGLDPLMLPSRKQPTKSDDRREDEQSIDGESTSISHQDNTQQDLPLPFIRRVQHQPLFVSRTRRGLLTRSPPLINRLVWSGILVASKFHKLIPHFMTIFPLSSSSSSSTSSSSSSLISPRLAANQLTSTGSSSSSGSAGSSSSDENMADDDHLDLPRTPTGHPPSVEPGTKHSSQGHHATNDALIKQLSHLPLMTQIFMYNITKASFFPYSSFHPGTTVSDHNQSNTTTTMHAPGDQIPPSLETDLSPKHTPPSSVPRTSFVLSLFYQLPFVISLFMVYVRHVTRHHPQHNALAASLTSVNSRVAEQLRQIQNSIGNYTLNYKHPWRIMTSPFQPLSFFGYHNTSTSRTWGGVAHGGANSTAIQSLGPSSVSSSGSHLSSRAASQSSTSSRQSDSSFSHASFDGDFSMNDQPEGGSLHVIQELQPAPECLLTLQDEYRLYATFGLPSKFYRSIGLALTTTQQQQLQQHIQQYALSHYDLSLANLPQFCRHQQVFQHQHQYTYQHQQFSSQLQQQYQNQFYAVASSVMGLSLHNCIVDGVNLRILRHSMIHSFALAFNLQLYLHPYVLFYHSPYTTVDYSPTRLMRPSLNPKMLLAQFAVKRHGLIYPHDVYEPQQLSMLYPNMINTMPHYDEDGMLTQASTPFRNPEQLESSSYGTINTASHPYSLTSIISPTTVGQPSSTSSVLLSQYADAAKSQTPFQPVITPPSVFESINQHHAGSDTTPSSVAGIPPDLASLTSAAPASAGVTVTKTVTACETILSMGVPIERYIDMILLNFSRILQNRPYAYMIGDYDFSRAAKRKQQDLLREFQSKYLTSHSSEMDDDDDCNMNYPSPIGGDSIDRTTTTTSSAVAATTSSQSISISDTLRKDVSEVDAMFASLGKHASPIAYVNSSSSQTARGSATTTFGFNAEFDDAMWYQHLNHLTISDDAQCLADDIMNALEQHEDYQQLTKAKTIASSQDGLLLEGAGQLSFLESVVEPHCSLVNPHQCHDVGFMGQSTALYHNILASSSKTTAVAPVCVEQMAVFPSPHQTVPVAAPWPQRKSKLHSSEIAGTDTFVDSTPDLPTVDDADDNDVVSHGTAIDLHEELVKPILLPKRLFVKDTPSFTRFKALLGWYTCRNGCIEEFSIDIQRLIYARLHSILSLTGVFSSSQFQPQYLGYLQQYSYLYTDKTKWMVTNQSLIPYILEKNGRVEGAHYDENANQMVVQSTVATPKAVKTKSTSNRVTQQRIQAQLRWEKQNAEHQELLQQQLNASSQRGNGVTLTSEQLSLFSASLNAPTATLSSHLLTTMIYNIYFTNGVLPQAYHTTLSDYTARLSHPVPPPTDKTGSAPTKQSWPSKKRFGLAATKAAALSTATSVASSSLTSFSLKATQTSNSSFSSSSSSSSHGSSNSASAAMYASSSGSTYAHTNDKLAMPSPRTQPAYVASGASHAQLASSDMTGGSMNSNTATSLSTETAGVGATSDPPTENTASTALATSGSMSPGATPAAAGTLGTDGVEYFTLVPPQNDQVPAYCFCRTISLGRMVACENKTCPYEWFHFQCVGLAQSPKGTWYCLYCLQNTLQKRANGKTMKKLQMLIQQQRTVLTNNGLLPRAYDINAPVHPQVYQYYAAAAAAASAPQQFQNPRAVEPTPAPLQESQPHATLVTTPITRGLVATVSATQAALASPPPPAAVGRTSGGTPYVKSARIAAAAAAHQRQQYDAMLNSYVAAQAAASTASVADGNIGGRVASLRARPSTIAAAAVAAAAGTRRAPTPRMAPRRRPGPKAKTPQQVPSHEVMDDNGGDGDAPGSMPIYDDNGHTSPSRQPPFDSHIGGEAHDAAPQKPPDYDSLAMADVP